MSALMSCLDAVTLRKSERLRAWLSGFERVFVLTGTGCGTASGIPDYRDADGQWKRTPPVTYQAFTGDVNRLRSPIVGRRGLTIWLA